MLEKFIPFTKKEKEEKPPENRIVLKSQEVLDAEHAENMKNAPPPSLKQQINTANAVEGMKQQEKQHRQLKYGDYSNKDERDI